MSKYQRFEDVELWVRACSKPEVGGKSGGEHAALLTLREGSWSPKQRYSVWIAVTLAPLSSAMEGCGTESMAAVVSLSAYLEAGRSGLQFNRSPRCAGRNGEGIDLGNSR